MMNLDEHKVYVESHKMDMIPYTIVVKAIEEMQKAYEKAAIGKIENTISETLETLQTSFEKINSTIATLPTLDNILNPDNTDD